jgi:hypothetical protein
MSTQLVLERVSATIEASPGADSRTNRVRSGIPRRSVEVALQWLEREGYVDRDRAAAEWSYRVIKPYRAQRGTGRGKHYRGG